MLRTLSDVAGGAIAAFQVGARDPLVGGTADASREQNQTGNRTGDENALQREKRHGATAVATLFGFGATDPAMSTQPPPIA